MGTFSAKPLEIERTWFVVDASEYELGRLATRIAMVLRGKHKPTFTPHVDTGDFVVVTNASMVKLTGRKVEAKKYQHYTGYPGGLKTRSARDVRADDPERMLREAVAGMLPKNRLSRRLITKLKVYGGTDHPHTAQNPQPFPKVF
jgi:large subunit ribosomal protein L13